MLKVFLDLGAKEDMTDDVMCVAAVVFKPIPYKQFMRPWNRMLRGWGASAFHATDFYNGAPEFQRDTPERLRRFEQDSKRIPNLVGANVQRILAVSFRPEEYMREASTQWIKKFGTSLHSLAVQVCLLEMGWWAEDHCPSESFAYFMESGDPDERRVVETVEGMKNERETAAVLRVKSFSTVDKGIARGLEAADLMAWHWNKYYMDRMRLGQDANPRKDFAALVSATQNQVYTIFLTGENLKYFFSRVPKEVLEESAQ